MKTSNVLILCVVVLITVGISLEVSSCSKKDVYYVSVNGSAAISNCKPNDSNSPCGSLTSLVSTVHECAEFVLLDNPFILSEDVRFFGNSNVTLTGMDEFVVVHCRENVGLVYQNCISCSLEKIQFVGCQMDVAQYLNPPTLVHSLSSNLSTVLMIETSNTLISNCSFHSGAGSAVLLVNLHDETVIEGSTFLGNKEANNSQSLRSGGITMRHTTGHFYNNSISVVSCVFANNSNVNPSCRNYDELNLFGGAIDIILVAENVYLSIVIAGSNFSYNSACVGGAVKILQNGKNLNLNVTITDSLFYNNQAYYGGGAVFFSFFNGTSDYYTGVVNNYGRNLVHNCVFISNCGRWAGAIAAYSAECKHCQNKIEFEVVDTQFVDNLASESGFAIGLSGGNTKIIEDRHSMDFILSGNCTFWGNAYHDDIGAIGVISVQRANITFGNGTTTMKSNTGTALLLRDRSFAKFVGKVLFKNNTGVFGGAVLVQSKSRFFITSSSVIHFVENKALVYGGAFYSTVADGYNCVIQFDGKDPSKFNVYFSNNTLHTLDQSVFIQTSKPCEGQKDLIFNGFKISPPGPFQVVFPPDDVGFLVLPAGNEGGTPEIMLGEPFYVMPTFIKDLFHKNSIGVGYMYYKQKNFTDEPLIILGPKTINFDDFTANITFSVIGPKVMGRTAINISFFFQKQSNYHIGSNTAEITIVPCRLGYNYSESMRKCVCVTSDKVKCLPNSRQVCVKYHYWYSSESKSVYPCPRINCEYLEGKCPNKSSKCLGSDDYCSVVHADDVCWGGRTGILCSECAKEYSFTLGAFRCVHRNTCCPKYTVILVVLLLLYWSLYAAVVLVILSLKLSVGSGFMYGIVYYFSVVTIYTKGSVIFSDTWILWLLTICEALSQLNCFNLLALIVPYCFTPHWSTTLPHILLQYIGPVFVISLISLTITCFRYCRLPKRFLQHRLSPIHAICMLVLFSYTSLSSTNFQLLLPQNIDGHFKVKMAPSISYFSLDHIPYALTAIFVELIVSLPICFLLLFAPCLSRRIDMVKYKLKPIVDEFQACYKPEFRWFAGFYFLARQLVYLINGLFSETVPQGNAPLILLNVLIWTVHALSQPYQKKWLNILDTLLLTDLVLLSSALQDPSNSDLEYSLNRFLHTKAIPYTLLILPSCYLVGSLLVIFVQKLNLKRLCLDKLCLKFRSFPLKMGPNFKEREVSQNQVQVKWDDSYYRDDGLREPLLEETGSDTTDVRSRSTGNNSSSSSSKVTYGSVEGYQSNSVSLTKTSTSSSVRNSQMNLFPPHH